MPILEACDVHYAYETHRVLRGVSLALERGKLYAILGPSGCGKTTLLSLLGGLDSPTQGQILFDGEDIAQHSLARHRRDHVSFVFQAYNLIDYLTPAENVALSGTAHPLPLLEQLGLTPEETRRRIATLSGGQQQRIALARAIVIHPQVLLMDEPLSNLDAKLRVQLRNELKKMQRDFGITTIYVTHDQEEALSMSDTVVVMDKGIIQQIGTPQDIYNEPKNAFVADFIGESNILDGIMHEDFLCEFAGKKFKCLDKGFAKDEPVDVVIRPEDIDMVEPESTMLTGEVTSVTFKGVHFEFIVDVQGFKWMIQSTDYQEAGKRIGLQLTPDDIHIMKKSEYSGTFGDYSTFSDEMDEYMPQNDNGEEAEVD